MFEPLRRWCTDDVSRSVGGEGGGCGALGLSDFSHYLKRSLWTRCPDADIADEIYVTEY